MSPVLSPRSQADSTCASPLQSFGVIQGGYHTRQRCFSWWFGTCIVSCLPPCSSSVAKSMEAIDSGLWRMGRDEGMLANTHAHTRTHTLKQTQTHTWITGWYCLRLLQGNKVIQRKFRRKWQGYNHVCLTAATLIRCMLSLHLTWVLFKWYFTITASPMWERFNVHMCCCQWWDVYQCFVSNRAVVGYRPLGGLLLFLHLMPLWFTSLETSELQLPQNGNQMQDAGKGESWPQRNLLCGRFLESP